MRLRTHLVLLVLAAVAPLLIFTVIIVRRDFHEQRVVLDRGLHDTVRALSLAVDGEVRTSLAILETLAASPFLDAGDLKAFHQFCARTIERHKSAWIVLFDPSGQQLVNSSRPFGAPLPNPFRQSGPPTADARYPLVTLGGAEPVRKIFQTRRPVVSDLFVALDSGQPTIGVGIPVVRGGEVRYALEMSLNPEVLLRLLNEQRPPADAITSIFDGKGLIIARTVDSQRVVGHPAAPELRAKIMASKEGSGPAHTLEGTAVAQAFTRSTLTGWTTWVALSEASAAAATSRAILLLSGGTGIALLVGLATAVILGKRVSTPISRLAGAAGAMARGESVDVDVAAVREVEELRAALVTAAQAVREGAAAHEQRVVAEIRRAEAQSANQAKDDFLAVLSHELRTPINAVYGWARMLHTGQIADDVRARALEAIIRNAHAQVQLIDDLLDVSRIISGKMRLDARPVDLKSVVEGALDAVRPAAEAKGTPLHATLDAGAGIVGDPDRLQQVVWNLLTNAIKFTPKGGQVQVLLHRVKSHVEIVVSDTGQGIAAEMLPVVFNRFWQADTGTTRMHKGLGLGLALVRHLVEAHGGTVSAHSAGEGKGATFIVTLPAVVEQTDTRVPVTMPAYVEPALAGVRVAAVDDDLDTLDLIAAVLTAAKADVRTCRSAVEAVTIVREWNPDVLIADIEMPAEDGWSLIRTVRAMDRAQGGEILAIALTAHGRDDDRARTLSAGFSMHIQKPIDPAELTTIVAYLMGRASPRPT